MRSKKNGELAHIIVQGLIDDITKRDDDSKELEAKLEGVFKNIIFEFWRSGPSLLNLEIAGRRPET